MEGKGQMKLAEGQSESPEFRDFYRHLKKDGKWIVRDDVWINYLERRGNLTVGFGSPGCIGPELEFGMAMGDLFEEPVLHDHGVFRLSDRPGLGLTLKEDVFESLLAG